MNLPDKFKIGTVGPALPGHTVRIAEDGEIEVKGIDVFTEYWNNPDATKAVFTDDGFFRTGTSARSTATATSPSPGARRRSS